MPFLSNQQLREFIERAVSELEAKSIGVDSLLHLDEATWSVDQDDGTIVFDCPNSMRATAPVQIIGTYNTLDETWLWARDHPSVVEPLRQNAEIVLEFAREQGISALTERKIQCQETDCWEFTALACKLCEAQSAYRGQMGTTRVYMTIGKMTLSAR